MRGCACSCRASVVTRWERQPRIRQGEADRCNLRGRRRLARLLACFVCSRVGLVCAVAFAAVCLIVWPLGSLRFVLFFSCCCARCARSFGGQLCAGAARVIDRMRSSAQHCRCSALADEGGMSPVPGADVGGVSPGADGARAGLVPVQTWQQRAVRTAGRAALSLSTGRGVDRDEVACACVRACITVASAWESCARDTRVRACVRARAWMREKGTGVRLSVGWSGRTWRPRPWQRPTRTCKACGTAAAPTSGRAWTHVRVVSGMGVLMHSLRRHYVVHR